MLGNNRGRDYDVIDAADGKVLVSVHYLTPTEPSDCCMCGRSTFDHFAVPYYCGPVRSGKSEGGYAPACRRCYDRWARWDDALEEYDSWLAVLAAGVRVGGATPDERIREAILAVGSGDWNTMCAKVGYENMMAFCRTFAAALGVTRGRHQTFSGQTPMGSGDSEDGGWVNG